MKRFHILIVLAALALVGCEELSTDQPEMMTNRFSGPLTLYATWSDESETKTAVQNDGVSVWWTTSEEINVFSGAAYSGLFTSTNAEPAASAYFSGSLNPVPGVSGNANDAYWAVYPYSETNTSDGQSITVSVPSHQTASEGTFADNLFPAVAKSATMDNMHFYNICGGACFTVSAANIRSVTFTGKGGETLSGVVRVSMDDNGRPFIQDVYNGETQVTVFAPAGEGAFTPGKRYYAVLIPQVLENGLDITFRTNSQMGTYELNKSVTITRSRFGMLEGKDNGVQYGNMPIDRLAFPDEQFGDYIFANFDSNKDGVLSAEECDAVTSINVSTDTVATVEGIEFFPNLQILDCYATNGTGLLKSLDVSKNLALRYLTCRSNQLTALDVSNNTNLLTLDCRNNHLTALDVSNNTALRNLSCNDNQLTALDVRNNTDLVFLYCYNNQLTSLNVNNNTALRTLNCSANLIASLNVANNTALEDLRCYSNELTTLNVTNNTDLLYLFCQNNEIASLDVTNNLSLQTLNCGSNSISSLNLSNNMALQDLRCYANLLTSLDVSRNTSLQRLSCYYNSEIGSLDLSANDQLIFLDCEKIGISSLDLSHNPNLDYLYCTDNQLTELDISENMNLNQLYCYNNPSLTTLYLSEGQTLSTLSKPASTAIVYVRNLGPVDFPDAVFRDYVFNNFDVNYNGIISHSERNAVNAIEIASGSISTLQGVEFFPNLTSLKVLNVGLSTLNVSANTALVELYCSGNSLTSLNVMANTALKELYCNSNSLDSLDVSCNVALEKLDIRNNPIVSLDLSHNGALNTLWCQSNQFTELDLSLNLLLKNLYCKNSPMLATVWVAKGHSFDTLEKDISTTIKEKSSGDGGGAEGFNQSEEGQWDE